jgi:hypothetical protein
MVSGGSLLPPFFISCMDIGQVLQPLEEDELIQDLP